MRLITGGSGMVGQHTSGDVHLSSADCDLLDFEETKRCFAYFGPTEIVHLAAKVGGVQGNLSAPGDFYWKNIMINTNVLEAARWCGVRRLLYASSSCIYSPEISMPCKEADQHCAPPFYAHSAYAYTKRMLHVQSQAYREQWGCDFFGVVLVNLYGPGDNFDEVNGHIIPSLISRCVRAQEEGTDFVVWGSGSPLREVVYVKDVGRIIDHLMTAPNLELVNLSPGFEISVKQIALAVAIAVGFTGNIVFDTSRPDGQIRKPTDNSRLREVLPADFRWTALSEGLKETVAWYRAQNGVVRR